MLCHENVAALCRRLGYLGADGALKQLDSLQQMELIIEAEQTIGRAIPVESVDPHAFLSLDALTAFLGRVSA